MILSRCYYKSLVFFDDFHLMLLSSLKKINRLNTFKFLVEHSDKKFKFTQWGFKLRIFRIAEPLKLKTSIL